MTVKLVGRDDVAKNNYIGNGVLCLGKFTAVATGVGTEMRVRVIAYTADNVILGIYADNAGAPAALLGTTASTAVSSDSERVVTIALVANVNITSGTDYWVSWQSQYANIIAHKTETAVMKYKVFAYAAFPNPAGTGYTDLTDRNPILAVWGTVAAPSAQKGGSVTAKLVAAGVI